MNILDEIVEYKKQEVARKLLRRDFLQAILKPEGIAIIAEIKLSSPSGGVLGLDAEIEARVRSYELGGADAISVVVDEKFFQGNLNLINRIKKTSSLPILAKDFIIEEYQVFEALVYGADAILLIARILSSEKLKQLVALSSSLGLLAIVEVNEVDELSGALASQAKVIAVNARDLDSFKIDLSKALSIGRKIPPERIFLGFSGVNSPEEANLYHGAGAKAVLVGSSLMKSSDPEKLIKELKDAS